MEVPAVADLTVAPEQLEAVAARLRAGAAEMEAFVAQLSGAVSPLLDTWTGAAQGRFDALWSAWRRDAAGLQETLVELAQLAARAADAYAATETSITGAFRPR